MTRWKLLPRSAVAASIVAVLSWACPSQLRAAPCVPDMSWFGDPVGGPAWNEINRHLGRPPDPCNFHSLAWQWFLHLMNPDAINGTIRNFENSENYFVLGIPACAECDDTSVAGYTGNRRELSGWFIRNVKEVTRETKTGLFG